MSEASGNRRNPGHWPPGESGNPEGRPKSARRNLNDAFMADIFEAWMRHGKTIIAETFAKYPDVCLYVVASLVPKQLKPKARDLIDDDAVLAARIVAARSDLKASERRESQSGGEGGTDRLSAYRPYPKQAEFHAAGAMHDERLLMAGNQLGKTLAGGMEWAMHLTGRYPDWWKGRVFESPVRLWAAGVTAESTRDNPQRILIGSPQQREKWGTGTIPKESLKDWTLSHGVGDGLDSVVVRWGGGGDVQQGESILAFKSYEKGREKWQGETLDGVWFDEEPPLDIYCEGRTRTVARRGIVIVTFTPLLGMSEVVKLFLGEADLTRLRKESA